MKTPLSRKLDTSGDGSVSEDEFIKVNKVPILGNFPQIALLKDLRFLMIIIHKNQDVSTKTFVSMQSPRQPSALFIKREPV